MRRVTPQPIIGNDLSASLLDRFREYSVALNQCAEHRLSEFVSVTGTYTAGENDHVIECAPSGAMTVTLPAASVMRNKRIVIKRTNNTTHTVTIQSSSGNIDGSASVTLTTAHQSREVFSDGANWWLLDTGATAPTDPYFANVVLLLHFDGSNGSTTFTDSSSYAKTPASSSGCTLSTTSPQFGTAALSSTTASADVTYTASTDFNLPLVYTIEFWIYLDALPGASVYIAGSSVSRYLTITSAGQLSAVGWNGTGFGACTLSTGVWQHYAQTRDGDGTNRNFLDGVLLGSGTDSGTSLGAIAFQLLGIPARSDLASFQGKIDDFRWTQGVARYTADFDVPTSAFPDS